MNNVVMKRIARFLSVFLVAFSFLNISSYANEVREYSSRNFEIAIPKMEVAPAVDLSKQVRYEPVSVSYQEFSTPVEAPVLGNRIVIPNVLNKPLMHDDTGEHLYLNHNMNGVYDGIGVPYTDFRTNFYTRKTIAYAHSSTAGNGPFNPLQNYHNNPSFFQSHRYITVYFEGNTYTYEIFSVYVSVADSEESEGLEYFQRMDYSDEEWQDALNRYKSHSEYETGVSVTSNDKILILQTCSMDPNYYEQYYRYNLLIMAKLV